HFRDLKHQQRLPYIHAIATADLRATTVLVHKPSIRQRFTFQTTSRLYFYTTRYLLERVSWYCADARSGGRSLGTGHAQIIFSTRSGMSYDDLRAYFRHLEASSRSDRTITIDRSVIKPDQISAHSPMKRMGLQIADAVASSFFYAVEPTMHGFTEPRYA